MTLWEKGGALDTRVAAFTVGDDYLWDRELVIFDCAGSVAHASALARAGLLREEEFEALRDELRLIPVQFREGRFEVLPEHEDVHTAVELHLSEVLGEAGRKLHAGRSRNDQVLTDLRLAAKWRLAGVATALGKMMESLTGFARAARRVPMPGYTHMRRAMPSTVGLWAAAFAESLGDDFVLLEAVYRLLDRSPLGSAAGFGSRLGLDRDHASRCLGFRRVQVNTLAVQNSRGKLELAVLEALGQIGLDLNRLASDLCLFSMPEFGFFELPEEITTGSSLMPQKRNPDVLELVRGRAHALRSYASRTGGMVHDLPSGYNRDCQLTKAPFLAGMRECAECLDIMTVVIENLKVNESRCREALSPELYATDRALALVRKGAAFRDAYRMVADELREGRLPAGPDSRKRPTAPSDGELSGLFREAARVADWGARERRAFVRMLRGLLGKDVPLPD